MAEKLEQEEKEIEGNLHMDAYKKSERYLRDIAFNFTAAGKDTECSSHMAFLANYHTPFG